MNISLKSALNLTFTAPNSFVAMVSVLSGPALSAGMFVFMKRVSPTLLAFIESPLLLIIHRPMLSVPANQVSSSIRTTV